ncbi:MAG: M20/M25/M40 family metallo-hydrolase [Clostridia bacterium]|nr:M20/M25/M40 family metallo-hydrolase [Clostridia bacterium]
MNYLKTLSALEAPSGAEHGVAPALAELLKPYTSDVRITALGSVVGVIPCGEPEAKKLMLDAHLDSVAAFVTELVEGGFVRVGVVGMDRRVMLNAEFTILGKGENVRAVPCVLPPHLQKESGKVPEDSEMAFDTGLPLDELKKKAAIGDPVIFTPKYAELLGGRAACTSGDNRASCAVVLRALELAKGKKAQSDVIVSFASQEESGGSGACTAAFEYAPDEAIILDVSFAQTPDTPYPKAGKLGGGVMIGFSPRLSRELTDRLRAAADRIGEAYQSEVMPRDTGTDADEIAVSGKGIPCAMLSTPLRYMHTPAEVTDAADIESAAKILAEYIING